MEVRALLKRLGSTGQLARDAGVTRHAVDKWRVRGTIPSGYWVNLIAGAASRGVHVSVSDFLGVTHARARASQEGRQADE